VSSSTDPPAEMTTTPARTEPPEVVTMTPLSFTSNPVTAMLTIVRTPDLAATSRKARTARSASTVPAWAWYAPADRKSSRGSVQKLQPR
jgi:hypothetical protein